MGFLSFKIEDLAEKLDTKCALGYLTCEGTSFELTADSETDTKQHLVAARWYLPMQDFGSSFDLLNNLARGRPLLTRYTTGAHVEYEVLRPANFDQLVWTRLWRDSCSGKMERSIINIELNHMYMEDPLQTTYTAALFYLFHNSRKVVSEGKILAFRGNDWSIAYAFTMPTWQIIASMVEGLLVFACAILVIKRSRAGYEDLVDLLKDPQHFARAYADSDNFPDRYLTLNVASAKAVGAVSLAELGIQSINFGSLPATKESVVIKRQPKLGQ